MRRVILAAFALALAVHADSLRLRSGAMVSGTYLGGTPDDVQFLAGDEVRHYRPGDVVDLTFGAGAAPRQEGGVADFGAEFVGVPVMRGPAGDMPLERAMAIRTRTNSIMGPGGFVYRVSGARSPVRVREGDRVTFIMRVDSEADIRRFQLYRLESRRDYRQTPPIAGGLPPSIGVTIRRVGVLVYEMTPAYGLTAGEYGISPTNSNDTYCFGVDR